MTFKKFFSIICAAILALTLFMPFTVAEESESTSIQMEVKVGKGQTLRLRKEADAASKELGAYKNGKIVTVLSIEGDWAKVSVDGKEGYMFLSKLAEIATTTPDDDQAEGTPGEGEDEGTTGEGEGDEETPGTTTMKVNTGNNSPLRLRKEANTSSKILGEYKNGTLVTVYEIKDGWAKVTVAGKDGYMAANMLVSMEEENPGEDEGEEEETPAATTMKVNTGNNSPLRLRKEANTSSKVLGEYKNGTLVTVYEIKDGWAKVTVAGKDGYMAANMLVSLEEENPGEDEGEEETPATITMEVKVGKGDSLRLRQEPNAASQILGEYRDGTKVTVHEVKDGWAKVTVGDKEGYMAYDKLGEVKEEIPAPTGSEMFVKGGEQTLYTEPKATSSVIATYPAGTKVIMVFPVNNWYRVYVDGELGYMLASALENGAEDDNQVTPPATGEYTLMKITNGKLAFRSTPERKSTNLIKYVNDGTIVKVYAIDNGWAQVAVDETIGYMMASYLKNVQGENVLPDDGEQEDGQGGETQQPENTDPTIKTVTHPKGSYVNFRRTPSDGSESNIIKKLPSGTMVTVVGASGPFAKITVNGVTGYINAAYLK